MYYVIKPIFLDKRGSFMVKYDHAQEMRPRSQAGVFYWPRGFYTALLRAMMLHTFRHKGLQ
jgi:hypothetical protein